MVQYLRRWEKPGENFTQSKVHWVHLFKRWTMGCVKYPLLVRHCTYMKGYKNIELILLNITGRRRIGGLKVNANLQ